MNYLLSFHEYELASETLDKILNIDPDADLEKILVGIAPEEPEDREFLLDALRKSQERDNPSVLVLIAGLEAQHGQLGASTDYGKSCTKNVLK